jgi:kumamolisin
VTSCGGTAISNVSGLSFNEGTWQDTNGWATGGGVSIVFDTVPSWQNAQSLPVSVNNGRIGRTIPDIAGNADRASGYEITVYGRTSPVGGTSAVAPLYAGLIANLNAKLGRNVGFLNPAIYKNPGVCRDISDGVDNATNDAPGYASKEGYDPCTGWGSLIGSQLFALFAKK